MSERLMQKLEERFNQGDYYEAHQIYRTIYYRLVRENKFAKIFELLYNGAVRFFEKGERLSGADLSNLLVETMAKVGSCSELNTIETKVNEKMRFLFANILPNSPERMQFVSKLLKIRYLPHGPLRKQFAEVLWEEKNFSESRLHFIYSSDNGNNCALMLVEYQTQIAYSGEFDLMIAQFVLQVLCIENQQLAHNTFNCYTLYHPMIRCSKPPFVTPLLNFLCLLFNAIDKFRGKSQIFNVLCNIYQKSLNRDPCYQDYLKQIGQIYFGIEKKPAMSSGGLFSNIFQTILDISENNDNDIGTNSGGSGNSRQTSRPSAANHEAELD